MDQMNDLISTLRRDNYCLMTDDNGVEIYDAQGHLLVCNSNSGECLSVPNSDDMRKLYDLQAEGGYKKTVGEIVDVTVGKNKSAVILHESLGLDYMDCSEDDTDSVWTGQRHQKSRDATLALIDLLNSPKYKNLMMDPRTVKLIIWEKIANDLQNQGFRIGKTSKESALKTFQKWRNMVRTYWKTVKNPDDCGEDKRKKKPFYFDAMNVCMQKKNKKVTPRELKSLNEEVDTGLTAELQDTIGNTSRWLVESFQTVPSSDPWVEKSATVEIAEETVYALVRIMVADKYKELFNGSVRKATIMDKVSLDQWDKVSLDLTASGYSVPGTSIREKSENLFQQWESIKQSVLSYQKSQKAGFSKIKPSYYDIIVKAKQKLIDDADLSSEDSMHSSNNLHSREQIDHDYEKRNHSVEVLKTLTSPLIPDTQTYDLKVEAMTTQSTFQPPDPNHSSTPKPSPATPKKHGFVLSNPTSPQCSRVRSCEMLQQIKTLQESALVVQQQCFSKIISLLEEQTKQQQTLTLLLTQYVKNQTTMNTLSNKLSSNVLDIDENPVLSMENDCN